jgi:hypothetical protein
MFASKARSACVRHGSYRSSAARRLLVFALWFFVPAFGLWVAASRRPLDEVGSPGSVHRGHAGFEHDCARCHTPPVGPLGFGSPTRADGVAVRDWGMSTGRSDENCRACHAAPPHHAATRIDDVPGCAACHTDHKGRDVSLSAVADAHCTRCHANLGAHQATGHPVRYAANVTGFGVAGHPEFKVRSRVAPGEEPRRPLGSAVDPGRLKFSHARHTVAGMRLRPDAPRGRTLGEVAADRREWYRAQQPGSPKDSDDVRLTCAACHQLDSADGGQPFPAGHTSGAYFQPIRYESHCRACHPLNADDGRIAVAHGLQPPAVRVALVGEHTRRLAPRPAPADPGRPPLPGRRIDGDGPFAEWLRYAERWLRAEDRARRDAIVLFESDKGCKRCHDYAPKADAAADGMSDRAYPSAVVRPEIPAVWHPHARFDHSPHRMLKCSECHPQAGTDGAGDELLAPAATSSAAVLLPGIDNCRRCHAPRDDGRPVARTTCVTCHRYHGGDAHPLGPSGRQPATRLPARDWFTPDR